jgi:hypothetical protein
MIFDVSENIFHKNKIRDSMLFNTGETSHTVMQRPEKFTVQKGKHLIAKRKECHLCVCRKLLYSSKAD